ncbi:MarC family protein [Methanohalobium sp.]|uniref:MarC family protein n=1 Tax=Methanohalobium sp. TaxID=2837493 RepID=UPI0025E212FD|nr:NAAT family transporter [Methanohalobium sp.]
MDYVGIFVFAFVSIFVIVDPLAAVVTFISLTNKMDDKTKNIVAKRAVLLACVIALAFALTGNFVLNIFGIGVDSLRIAGGILLFTVALDMMHAKISRESITKNEISEYIDREDVWIFPIALPLLTGPGAITTVIVLMGNSDTTLNKLVVIMAIIATFIITFYVFIFSRRLYKIMGYTGMLVFTRIMGLLLAAIAIEFITTGILNLFQNYGY